MQPLYLKNDTFLSHACQSHPLALASDCKSEIKMGKCLMKYRACACPAEQSDAACIKTSTRPQLQKRKKEIQSRVMRGRTLNRPVGRRNAFAMQIGDSEPWGNFVSPAWLCFCSSVSAPRSEKPSRGVRWLSRFDVANAMRGASQARWPTNKTPPSGEGGVLLVGHRGLEPRTNRL